MNRSELRALGFVGFRSVKHLLAHGLEDIPQRPGVYAVLLPKVERPAFLSRSVGGWFKGDDPTADKAELKKNWVDGTQVLYFGKADRGERKNRGLKKRIDELLKFGRGEPEGHKGGRYLWQVRGSQNYLIAWRETPRRKPSDVEWELMHKFHARFGSWPFANIQGPRRPSARAT